MRICSADWARTYTAPSMFTTPTCIGNTTADNTNSADKGKKKRRRRNARKAMEDEKRFHELKSKFFGISFTDGTIQVHVLESVQEHLDEGVAMHHCVFDNAYYLKENSLILSATIEGRRIKTIEVNLDTLKVVQSRGVCIKNTEYHDQIVSLVNANRKLIR